MEQNESRQQYKRKNIAVDTRDYGNRQKKQFYKKGLSFWRWICGAVVLFLGSFGTVYAASPAFREYVHSLLFPLYTSDEIVSIDNGHMAGSFDKTKGLQRGTHGTNRI